MKIAICQINPIIANFDHNIALIEEAAWRAKNQGCDLAVFPEMCLTGYPPKDLLEKPAFVRENLHQLELLAERASHIPLLLGYVERNPRSAGKTLINSAALLRDGKISASGGKRLLPSYDVFDESRYFEPAQQSLTFDLGAMKYGVTICEDIWNRDEITGVPRYAVDPVNELCAQQIDILINISASPYSLGKERLRFKILSELCKAQKTPAIYCNQIGGNDDLLFDGSSMVIDARGKLVALGKSFEPDILTWSIHGRNPEIQTPWISDEAAILKGLIMGTRDYTQKCGFKRVLVGLSGGIDSSLVAYIAVQALGAENVLGVSMPSPYTSLMSREDARYLAENLGIPLEEIPIGRLFDGFRDALATIFSGLPEDETEENIQARIRGNLLMALSNKLNALLLTTGNKSEMAMGYCTLYGDMSGGLAVISDVPKTLCYRLAAYINRAIEIIPSRIIARPPSAELRPNQTDQDSLPPYEILDKILEGAIERNLSPQQIVADGHDPTVVEDVMRRLVTNEYKRRQAPPGLKITSKAFGSGRRYPIARGNRAF
jgi:NAD+ synthase (glutamine-hydrolysing)